MRLKRPVILLTFLIMLLCFGCKEHNREFEESINIINKKFDKINNYVADYSITDGGELTFVGTITFVRPDITRVEIVKSQSNKYKTIIYSNDNFKYMYFPQWNEAIKEKLVKKTNKKYNFIYHSAAGGEEILSLVYNGKIRIGGDDFFEFKATMGSKDKSVPVSVYAFLFDIKTGCVKRFSYSDNKTGKKVIHEFENYKINIPINRKEVELSLPSDTRITKIN